MNKYPALDSSWQHRKAGRRRRRYRHTPLDGLKRLVNAACDLFFLKRGLPRNEGGFRDCRIDFRNRERMGDDDWLTDDDLDE